MNVRKNGDKYTRQFWDKVGPCVHTRNDQLASQNTIHPSDDRVFSIRELMMMMTVPFDFKWSEFDLPYLNSLPYSEKKAYLKKEAIKIRQSLGEAVPTVIFRKIADNIGTVLNNNFVKSSDITNIASQSEFSDVKNLTSFVTKNPMNLSLSALGRIAELSNTKRTDDGAFYTNKALITEMIKYLPDFEKDTLRILEPSAGVGNFIPLLLKRYEGKELYIDMIDINAESKVVFKALYSKVKLPETVHIRYITDDFLTHNFSEKYDLVVGNPPFFKMKQGDPMLKIYRKNVINKDTTNICSFFLEKVIDIADYVAIVFPKFLLNTPEFEKSRDFLKEKSIPCIVDFGENGFKGVLIETIAIYIDNSKRPGNTLIVDVTNNTSVVQKQKYIMDSKYPYWLIYRDKEFDKVADTMTFDCFDVFRDRQITNSFLKSSGDIRVIKSRNINDAGTEIVDISGYDGYVNECDVKGLSVYKYLDSETVYLTPNMTYKPRVIQKPKHTLVNGSVAILIPKTPALPTKEQLSYFSTEEYREFYRTARNRQTRSLNVDNSSVFFFGIKRSK